MNGFVLSQSVDMQRRPLNWEKWLMAAHLRRLGATQGAAARSAGVGRRTLIRWEADPRWGAAKVESIRLWGDALDDAARRRLLVTLQKREDSGELALKVLERTDPRLAPAKQRVEAQVDHRVLLLQRLEMVPIEDRRRLLDLPDEAIQEWLDGGGLPELPGGSE